MENLDREPIGQKGGASTTGTMRRETTGEKVREGWNDFKMKVQEKWNKLTDNDLDTYSTRDRNDFVGYVHNNVGGDRGAIERDIDGLARDTNYRWP